MSEIIWTKTDEAPMLASYSLFPILESFLKAGGISIVQRDISLGARIIAAFNDRLKPEQRVSDDLKILGEMTEQKSANIIKLPNISASVPQLNAAVAELRAKGYDLPLYVANPKSNEEKDAFARYQKVLGSAVNPVLRQGNSDRRCVKAVKDYARANPHHMGEWSADNPSEVVYMKGGDFYANERSVIMSEDDGLRVEFVRANGEKITLKDELKVQKGEIIDATFMSAAELKKFINNEILDAKAKDLLFSVHLKATMMKVSDPVIFGYFVREFFSAAFDEFKDEFKSAGINQNDGLGSLFDKISSLPNETQAKIKAKFDEIYAARPELAMVNSSLGVTNLHVPNDVIIDASMPAMIRNSGKMWDKNGKLKFTKAVIPDSTYARVYEAAVRNFKQNGTLDVASIGSVSNVGLMAKKAEEYGSHDKTFIMDGDGVLEVLNSKNEVIFKFNLKDGDIFRMTQAKDDAVQSWIDLAAQRAKISGEKLIFWLDENRAHDRNLKEKLAARLREFDLAYLDFEILDYAAACEKTLNLIRAGKNVIGVTGNVLRDYLTDLFPILELGTSAKMLSVVPLLKGGGVFETGAGGTAPMLARELIEQNHLSWDSLGEYLALIASLEHFSSYAANKEAKILSKALDAAVGQYLAQDRSPKVGVGEADTRTSHFYLALYWSGELAKSKSDLAQKFSQIYEKLKNKESIIAAELLAVQGSAANAGGYYKFDDKLAARLMRPSLALNEIIGGLI